MTVAFVIPHRENLAMLESAVASVRRLDSAGAEVRIFLVDNGSSDGASVWAAEQGLEVIRFERNEGFSRAVNRGIESSAGEFVAVLNDDVELAPDWLAHLLAAMRDDDVWFACGKTLDFARRDRIDGAGDAVCRGGTAWRLGHGRPDGPWFDRPRATYFPSATATLFRREFFERAGLYEETFFAYLEDIDLGLRASLAGLSGAYSPAALAYHRGSQTGGAWSEATVSWMTSHQLLLLAKFYPPSLLVRYARRILAAQLLWAALAVSRGRGAAWWTGIREGLRRGGVLRAGSARLRSQGRKLSRILEAAEAEIELVQHITGFDVYWKWYFRLAWPSARGTV